MWGAAAYQTGRIGEQQSLGVPQPVLAQSLDELMPFRGREHRQHNIVHGRAGRLDALHAFGKQGGVTAVFERSLTRYGWSKAGAGTDLVS